MDTQVPVRGQVREGESDGRTRLLDAARDLFIARGYAAVSIGEISAAAGMTRAAPYYHFKDKEDLFVQVLLRETGKLTAEFTRIIQQRDVPFRERLERIIVFAFETVGSDTGRLVDDLERHVAPERRQQIRECLGNPVDMIRPLFEEAAAAGEIRRVSPEVAATVFLATVSGLMEMVFREKHRLPEQIGPADFVDVLLHGF